MIYSVHIANLSSRVTITILKKLFKHLGVQKDLYIHESPEFDTVTYGFVRFKDLEKAKQAIEEFDGYSLYGYSMKLAFAKETRQYLVDNSMLNNGVNSLKDKSGKSKSHTSNESLDQGWDADNLALLMLATKHMPCMDSTAMLKKISQHKPCLYKVSDSKIDLESCLNEDSFASIVSNCPDLDSPDELFISQDVRIIDSIQHQHSKLLTSQIYSGSTSEYNLSSDHS